MQFPTRRFLFRGVGAVLFIAALALGFKFLFSPPITVGEFSLPKVAGWTHKPYPRDSPNTQFVSYYKKERELDDLLIRFGTKPDAPISKQKTAQELQKEEAQHYQEMAIKMKNVKQKLQWSPPEVVTVNGIPAVKTHSVTYDKSSTQYIDQWSILKSGRVYGLTSVITVSPTTSPMPPSEYKQESDRATKEILDSLSG